MYLIKIRQFFLGQGMKILKKDLFCLNEDKQVSNKCLQNITFWCLMITLLSNAQISTNAMDKA